MSEKPWNGRFKEKTNAAVEAFTSSIEIDKRLFTQDINGSIAHCRMLAKAKIINESEAESLVKGLTEIREKIEKEEFKFDDSLEDIHMHIEDALTQRIPESARKLHTARSRNDQVALDTKLYLKEITEQVIKRLKDLRQAIVAFAEKHLDTVMPGYTHLQRAQPVLLAHHMMAYYEMFSRDAKRFEDGLKRLDENPLGSAALAGTTYPIDREYTTGLLHFSKMTANSMDAVSDRDFILEFLSSASICMVHFSRISEELIIWSSSEFNFIELSDAFATGSSIMPQKKNPDVPEIVRGKAGRVFGSLMTVLTIMKSLPLAYNRDMQEDKPPLFDAADTLLSCIDIYVRMLPEILVKKEHMLSAASKGFLNATDMADYLVGKGVPFRDAHACVGKAVSYSLGENKELHELSLNELKTFSNMISEDIFECLTVESMINRRISDGGTARENVKTAVSEAKKELEKEQVG